jgi:hypothetical protein
VEAEPTPGSEDNQQTRTLVNVGQQPVRRAIICDAAPANDDPEICYRGSMDRAMISPRNPQW